MRVVQALGWSPVFGFNLLGLFIGIHAVGVTSCGNSFSRTRTLGYFSGFLAIGALSYDSVDLR